MWRSTTMAAGLIDNLGLSLASARLAGALAVTARHAGDSAT